MPKCKRRSKVEALRDADGTSPASPLRWCGPSFCHTPHRLRQFPTDNLHFKSSTPFHLCQTFSTTISAPAFCWHSALGVPARRDGCRSRMHAHCQLSLKLLGPQIITMNHRNEYHQHTRGKCIHHHTWPAASHNPAKDVPRAASVAVVASRLCGNASVGTP